MPKGKPWSMEEEKQLRRLVEVGNSLHTISVQLQKSPEAVRAKIKRLGLEVVDQSKNLCSSTSKLILPKELPSVEEALKLLSGALKALDQSSLDNAEIQRLRTIIQGVKIYKELFADYVDYRGIEAELVELRRAYEERVKKAKVPAKKSA